MMNNSLASQKGQEISWRDISKIQIGERFRRVVGNLDTLTQSIESVGLLHPVVITPNGKLIAGQRRLKACKKLGWQKIPVNVVDLENILRGENDENAVRTDLLPSETVAIAKALEPKEREAAKGRQGERTDKHPGKLPGSSKGDARDKVAASTGMSGRTLEKATAVVEAAKKEPKKYKKLVEEMDRTGRVSGVHRKLKVQRQVEKIRKEPKPAPKGPFRVIVMDPPWAYEKRSADSSHRAASPYPEMSFTEIAVLPVRKLACQDSILWLWTTNAHMRAAIDLIDSWDFTYKTILTWAKDRMGTGDWLRGQTEHCVMAVRGKPTVNLTNQTTLLRGSLREHSRKPEEFYKLVETLCPGSKLEMFSRQERKGWQSHGDEKRHFKKK